MERTCFPLPFEIKYLTEKTKLGFLDEVDLSTTEKRMKVTWAAFPELVSRLA